MRFGIEDDFLQKYLGPGQTEVSSRRLLSDDEKLSLWDRARANPVVMQKAVDRLGPEGTRRWAAAMEQLARTRQRGI